jgi:carbonic anhydrase/acetyltransferase-like protein (isoleucine patch superfamily)
MTVVLEESAHIGHGAIIHGAHIGENCLVGMSAVVMDYVGLGKESIIGALCFVKEGMEISDRNLLVGNPAEVVKEVSDEMIRWKSEGTKLYQQLPGQLHDTLKECEPLREEPDDRPDQSTNYETWGKRK